MREARTKKDRHWRANPASQGQNAGQAQASAARPMGANASLPTKLTDEHLLWSLGQNGVDLPVPASGTLPPMLHPATWASQSETGLLDMITTETAGVNIQGWTPLHLAAWHCSSVPAVRKLVAANMEAARTVNTLGELPLHLAVERNTSDAALVILRQLIVAAPDALKVLNNQNRTPVDYAQRRIRSSPDIAALILSAATEQGLSAILEGAPLAQVCQAAATSLALDSRTTWGLPREDCSFWCLPDDVLIPLITPHAAQEVRGQSGPPNQGHAFLPLHVALTLRKSSAVVGKLVDAYPGALQVHNPSGFLPIHQAAKDHGDVEVVQTLAGGFRAGLLTEVQSSSKKLVPLHLAAQYNPNEEVVKVLIAWAPGALSLKDSGTKGQTPRDTAKKFNPNPKVAALLKEANTTDGLARIVAQVPIPPGQALEKDSGYGVGLFSKRILPSKTPSPVVTPAKAPTPTQTPTLAPTSAQATGMLLV